MEYLDIYLLFIREHERLQIEFNFAAWLEATTLLSGKGRTKRTSLADSGAGWDEIKKSFSPRRQEAVLPCHVTAEPLPARAVLCHNRN